MRKKIEALVSVLLVLALMISAVSASAEISDRTFLRVPEYFMICFNTDMEDIISNSAITENVNNPEEVIEARRLQRQPVFDTENSLCYASGDLLMSFYIEPGEEKAWKIELTTVFGGGKLSEENITNEEEFVDNFLVSLFVMTCLASCNNVVDGTEERDALYWVMHADTGEGTTTYETEHFSFTFNHTGAPTNLTSIVFLPVAE